MTGAHLLKLVSWRRQTRRRQGRSDPGSLEICATKHWLFSVDLGRSQFNPGCWVYGQLEELDRAGVARGGYVCPSPAYSPSTDPSESSALSEALLTF